MTWAPRKDIHSICDKAGKCFSSHIVTNLVLKYYFFGTPREENYSGSVSDFCLLTCVRLDCLATSLVTWLESCEARADRDRVTDRANLANLLNPPRSKSESADENVP